MQRFGWTTLCWQHEDLAGRAIVAQTLTRALDLIQAGEMVAEISAGWPGGAGIVL
jgi:hypothetical protein